MQLDQRVTRGSRLVSPQADRSFTGDIFPNFPEAGGAATDALTVTVEFVVVDGSVSRA
jgi:hypothetical protein